MVVHVLINVGMYYVVYLYMYDNNLTMEQNDFLDRLIDDLGDISLEEVLEEQHRDSVILQDIQQDNSNMNEVIIV